MLDAYTYMITK